MERATKNNSMTEKEVILIYLKQFGTGMVRCDWLVEQITAMPVPPLEEKENEKPIYTIKPKPNTRLNSGEENLHNGTRKHLQHDADSRQ